MSEAVRFGIVGAGSIALRGLFPHLTMDDVADRVRITAVCEPVLARAGAMLSYSGAVPSAFRTISPHSLSA